MNRYKYSSGVLKPRYYAGQILKIRKPTEGLLDLIKVLGPEKVKRTSRCKRWVVICAEGHEGRAVSGTSSEISLMREYEPV